MPASSAAVPNLVPETRLEWANSTARDWPQHRPADRAAGRRRPGRRHRRADGVRPAAVAFVLCAAIVGSVSGRFSDVRTPARAEQSSEVRAGFVAVWHSPVLRGIAAAWMVFLFMLGPILVAELPLAHEFGQGAAGYGVIAACWGGGSILGRSSAANGAHLRGPLDGLGLRPDRRRVRDRGGRAGVRIRDGRNDRGRSVRRHGDCRPR